MKHFKRLFSYLVALTMVLSMATFAGVNVHADNGYKIILNNASDKVTTKDHTYHAYQIFSGDLKVNKDDSGKETSKVLSNIQWGTGIDSSKTSGLINALKKDSKIGSKFNDANDAASVAKALEDATSEEVDKFAEIVNEYLSRTSKSSSVNAETKKTEITGLSAGYYLVKDSLDTDTEGNVKNKSDVYSKYIVDVVGDTEATIKSDVPTVVKKVKDTNDSTGVTTDWQDSADYDIGDSVPYQITGTMPSNISDYTSYKYIFTDTMSKGLSYTAKNATIEIGDKDVTSSFKETVTSNTDGSTTVTWSCDNFKGISGVTIDANTKVVVTYNCTLNENAVIGSAGNPNTVYLTYSNNPNKGGEGETGHTPTDKNIVFTYKVVVNKVDQDQKPLSGAKFDLLKKDANGDWQTVASGVEAKAVKDAEGKIVSYTAEYKGLDDGTYVLKETKTPAGYNTIADQYFTITAGHDITSDDPQLTSLSGNALTGSVITLSADKDAGSLTTNVENKGGSTLPSTGGMGTTLLYAAGGILVACAAAYVIISRKKSAKK